MKYTYRTFIGFLTLVLVLGSVGCGKTQETDKTNDVTSSESALVAYADPIVSTEPDAAVEEGPGTVWLVPSEAECPAASRDDAPLVMTAEDVSPTQATLVLRAKDGSEFGIGYGPAYRISRYTESGWVIVGPGRPFQEPSYRTSARLEHWDTVELAADGVPLTPGFYRVETEYATTVNGERVAAIYYAYFEIAE